MPDRDRNAHGAAARSRLEAGEADGGAERERATQQEQKGTEGGAGKLPPRVDEQHDPSGDGSGHHPHEGDPPDKAAWAIVALTCVTAIAAIAASVFTGLQWWEAHTGSRLIEKQVVAAQTLADAAKTQAQAARDQVNALQSSVDVAKQGVGVARDQLQNARNSIALQTRPYVKVVVRGFQGFSVGSQATAIIDLINSGQSPARRVAILSGMAILRYPYGGKMMSLLSRGGSNSVTLSIQPGIDAPDTLQQKQRLTDGDIQVLKSGFGRMYLFVAITYFDLFDRPHHTFMCQNVHIDAGGATIAEVCETGRSDD